MQIFLSALIAVSYHKLDGIKSDGSEGGFSEAEVLQLKGALNDLANRIYAAASKL